MYKPSPPDWQLWGDQSIAMIWECVALSCDIDPESISIPQGVDPSSANVAPVPPEYTRRLKVAERAPTGEDLPIIDKAKKPIAHMVTSPDSRSPNIGLFLSDSPAPT